MAQDFATFLKESGIESQADYAKEQKDFEAKAIAASKQQKEQLEKNIAATEEYRKKMASVESPAPPNFSPLPTAPQEQYRDPLQALGGLGALVALIGSFKTRQPMTAALNAASGAMIGFHQGDVERVKRESEIFNDNMKLAIERNRQEVEKYNAALGKYHGDLEKARGEWTAIASENDNRLMLSALDANNLKLAHELHNEMDKRGIDLAKAYQSLQLRHAMIDAAAQKERNLQDYRAHILGLRNAQQQLTKDRARKGSGAIDTIVKQLDETIDQIEKNPQAVGIPGVLSRGYENYYGQVANVLGTTPPKATPATDLRTAMLMLQVEVASALHFSRASKFSVDLTQQALHAAEAGASPQAAVNSLKQVRAMLQEIKSENEDYIKNSASTGGSGGGVPSALEGVKGKFPGDTVSGPDDELYMWDGKQWTPQ